MKTHNVGADLALDGSKWVVKPLISWFSAPMRYTSLTSGRRPKINASCNSNENSRVTFCWLSIYKKSRTIFPRHHLNYENSRAIFLPENQDNVVLSLEEKFSAKFRRPYIRTVFFSEIIRWVPLSICQWPTYPMFKCYGYFIQINSLYKGTLMLFLCRELTKRACTDQGEKIIRECANKHNSFGQKSKWRSPNPQQILRKQAVIHPIKQFPLEVLMPSAFPTYQA